MLNRFSATIIFVVPIQVFNFKFFCSFLLIKILEQICRDTITSGTACFGVFLTVLRFHYNYERSQCEPFQYYGCNGSGNNFISKQQCETTCHPPVRNGIIIILIFLQIVLDLIIQS